MYGTKRLGEWLIQKGKITPEQLQTALETQQLTGERIGKVLIDLDYITHEDYYEAQAEQYDVPYEPLSEQTIESARSVASLISQSVASRYFVVPLRQEGAFLWVATADPNNIEALDYLRQAMGYLIQVCYSPAERILSAINKLYGASYETTEAELLESEPDDTFDDTFEESDDLAQVQETINQPPIIRLVNGILHEAIERGASDIHFEPGEHRLQVRVRIDGVLLTLRTIPRSAQAPVIARIKLMAEMDITERRKPQDGRFSIRLGERKVDARVSSLPTVFGERIVLRLLDRTASLRSLEQLGMPEPIAQHLLQLASRPWGMILVTGPTGSGKSTTLYALLQKIRSDKRNILTCEDPVEYTIEGIGQSQVNEKVGLTFASQLRAILRQDPDVVLVGEIRDRETAEIACRAAMTGHLVLSTLHTNDATSAPARLVDMEIEPYLINSSLLGVLAQRLVRKLCERCQQPVIHAGCGWLPQGMTLYEPSGCDACNHTGYKGRIGMYELFVISDAVRRQIHHSADNDQVRACAPPGTLYPMEEHARHLVQAGITSVEEVLAHLNWRPAQHDVA